MKGRHKAFDAWLDVACEAVPRRARASVRDELLDHLEGLREALMAEGVPEGEASAEAVERMGDAGVLAVSLGLAHRVDIPWGVWLFGLGLSALGVAVFAADGSAFFGPHLTWSALGLALGLGCIWIRPRYFTAAAPWLYGATLAGVLGVGLWGARSQGQAFLDLGVLKINLLAVSPLLFVVALCGMMARRGWHRPREVWEAVGWVILPSVLLVLLRFPAAGLATLIAGGAMVLSLNVRAAWRLPLALGLSGLALMFLLTASLGGLLAPLALQPATTVAHTDGIFARSVASLGWGAGLGLLVMGVGFAIAAARWASRAANPLARAGWVGILALFGVEFLWNLLALQGLVVAPHGGIALPFVSYGGSHTVLQLAALGAVSAATIWRPAATAPKPA